MHACNALTGRVGVGERRKYVIARPESDTFSVVVVQDFERVVVEDGDDRSGEVGSKRGEDVE